jgi:hypothetical protein
MLIFEYIDSLPRIPLELLIDPALPDESKIGFQKSIYKRWSAKPELLDWLKTNICNYVNIAGVQTIEDNLEIHCDRRNWAVNYLIKTGGPNVVTTFYQYPGAPIVFTGSGYTITPNVDLKPIKEIVIEPGRWHIINTHILHGVSNIESHRKAITIGLNSAGPYDELKV